MIVVPSHEDGLLQTFADAHRRYTGSINARNRWTGHLAGKGDALVRVTPVLDRYGDFADFLVEPVDDADAWRILRQAETSVRPAGNAEWIAAIEIRTGRKLAP